VASAGCTSVSGWLKREGWGEKINRTNPTSITAADLRLVHRFAFMLIPCAEITSVRKRCSLIQVRIPEALPQGQGNGDERLQIADCRLLNEGRRLQVAVFCEFPSEPPYWFERQKTVPACTSEVATRVNLKSYILNLKWFGDLTGGQ
jgi:hypothetical protein